MARGKQSSEGQALRRQQIIDYIRKNGPVKGSRICADLNMSRSSLSDDIRAVNTGGRIILSPKKGVYVIGNTSEAAAKPYSRIDGQSVRRWMILLSLAGKDRTIDEIREYLQDSEISCSKSVLYGDLNELVQAGIVSKNTDGRQNLYRSESLYETDMREISQYEARKAGKSARVGISAFSSIDLKIKRSIPGYKQGTEDGGTKRAGRHNILTEEQMQMLQNFERFPYKEKELCVLFSTNAGREITRNISVGIIVYAVETARIYLIGENMWNRGPADENGERNNIVIPMDSIVSITEGNRVNTCYNTPKFHQIYREMFQISAEKPMDVRVRFENFTFIRDKIERLCAARETAHMEIVDNEIIFTDRIRGKGDFARYLRRFGRSAIVEQPVQLREDMINASKKILALY